MSRLFLLGMLFMTFLVSCCSEGKQAEGASDNIEEFNFGPSP